MENSNFLLGFVMGFLIDKIALFPLIIGFSFGTITTNLYGNQLLINNIDIFFEKIKNLINFPINNVRNN